MRFLVIAAIPTDKSPEIRVEAVDDQAAATGLAQRAQEMTSHWAEIVGGYPGTVFVYDSLGSPETLGSWVSEHEEAARE